MKNINGRLYTVRRFTSVDSANDFCKKNTEWGVIHERKNPNTMYIDKQHIIWCAKMSDKGIPVSKK